MMAHARCGLTSVQQSQWTHKRSNQMFKSSRQKLSLGVKFVAGLIIAVRLVTKGSGSMTGNDEFILETIAGPLNRETSDVFSLSITTCEQESRSRMRTDRGEVAVEEARQQRVRRVSTERNEYEVIRAVLRNWCDSCVKRRAKHSHGCPISQLSEPLAVRDCGFSSHSMKVNSPTVLVLLRRIHGAEARPRMPRKGSRVQRKLVLVFCELSSVAKLKARASHLHRQISGVQPVGEA